MSGEELRVGPFVGGLNTLSDASAIADNELAELINFELDIDGSLVSRPPIVDLETPLSLGVSGNMKFLGYFVTTGGAPYLIASDGENSTYYFDGGSWTLITDTVSAAAMTQFKDSAWLVAPIGAANPGGKWDPTAGFTTEPNMPEGAVITSNKERLWLGRGSDATSDGTRLYLTDLVAGVVTWSSPASYIDIGPGDGQNIVDLAVYYSDLIVFKEGSTYRFAYDSDPSIGTVARVSENIGAAAPLCHASYENRLYVLFDNKVYEFTNYSFDRLNMKVPLRATNPSVTLSEYSTISVWADRLFISYYDRLYIYNLRTRVWCEWSSTVLVNIGRVLPVPGLQGVTPTAYMYSTTPRTNDIYQISDVFSTDTEEMSCTFTTKNYDYQAGQRFKRLFWWGVDALCRTTIDSVVKPVTYVASVIWTALSTHTWGSLADNAWDRPLDVDYSVADSVTTQGLTGGRKYVKFLKSLRFRQVAFKVTIDNNGSSSEAPVRVFSIMTGVRDKAMVTKRIS